MQRLGFARSARLVALASWSCAGASMAGAQTEYSGMLRVGGAVLPDVVLSAELDVWELDRTRGGESATWELLTAQYYPILHRGLYVSAGQEALGLGQP